MQKFVSEAQAYQEIRRSWKHQRSNAQRRQSALMAAGRVDYAYAAREQVSEAQLLLNRYKTEKKQEKETA